MHHELDIRDRQGVLELAGEPAPGGDRPRRRAALARSRGRHSVRRLRHQRGRHAEPARGGARSCPESPFVYLSTNKVYGDGPEPASRWSSSRRAGTTPTRRSRTAFPKRSPIDQSLHSLFGASKVAGDVMVQEYGRYFGMPTCCLRGGCLTGPESQRRRAARLPELPGALQSRGARVPDLRLQGQAGPRQHPQPRRRAVHPRVRRGPARSARSTTSAAARPIPAASSKRSRWLNGMSGQAAALHLRRDESDRRSHLLLQRPPQDAQPLSRAGTSPSRSSRRSSRSSTPGSSKLVS